MSSVLITGGTGYFARHFVDYVLERGLFDRVCVLSRHEANQAKMRQRLDDDRMRYFIGDVRDKWRLVRAMGNVDVVIHAAALKRIEVGAYNPDEMVKTNILGTMNVIEAAHIAGVERVVALSSDKAFQPCSPYGQSKALMETLMLAANATHEGTHYSVCRYGNVWRSTASVVPTWEALIADGAREVPVTDPECTRFFMTPLEAVELVLETLDEMPADKPMIPKDLPAYRLGDLAEAMGVVGREIGLPWYEKIHECMDFGVCSDRARRMTVEELRGLFSG